MFTTRPELSGTFGMVASTHWLASQAGMAVLERGGNAFDAAAATGFALQVVEPHLNGPGGDMSLLFRRADGPVTVLCGQGPAPVAATLERLAGLGVRAMPGTGLLSAAVPGATPAWLTLLRDHGTMTPAEVLHTAIGYADAGHPASAGLSATISRMGGYFAAHWPSSAATWLPAPQPGELLRNPTLARTYRRLAAAGGSAHDSSTACDAALTSWSSGFVADAIVSFVRTALPDSTGAANAGLLDGADLDSWQPTYESPMIASWRGWQVAKCGPWSQAPAFLETLGLLDPLVGDAWDGDADQIHLVVEALKLALADRDAWLGDALGEAPGGVSVECLLREEFLRERRRLIGAAAATELQPGRLDRTNPVLPELGRGAEASGDLARGEPTVRRPQAGDTCHLDVVDRWGNVVAATPSGGWLQSSPTIPSLGFCLGTRLQMTWLQPGLPSTLTSGRRPRTTLSPTLAIAPDGRLLGFGTPGGDQQEQWQLVFFLRHALGGSGLQEAIDAPTFHTTHRISSFDPRGWEPAGLEVEGRVPARVITELGRRGHRVRVSGDWSLGRLSAASWHPGTRIVRAAADPRGMSGYAVGR